MHKNILIHILRRIYADADIGPHLGFKGGTAAMMFYGLPRFSVDLDFDLVDNRWETRMLRKLLVILAQFGDVREATKKRWTLFFLVSYQKGERLVKIEISRRPGTTRYETKSFLGVPMLVISRPDMVASKLAALVTRKHFAARDVFDIWFFLKNGWEMSETVLMEKSGLSKRVALQKAIKRIGGLKQSKVLEGIGELVDEEQKRWIRNHLKEEVLLLLAFPLDNT